MTTRWIGVLSLIAACTSSPVLRSPASAPAADDYLNEWKAHGGGTHSGIGIRANGEEEDFRINARRSDPDWYREPSTGKELLKIFEDFTARKGCIPKVIMAGHGWGSWQRTGGPGFPLIANSSGLYLDTASASRARIAVGVSAAYLKDLDALIDGHRGLFGAKPPTVKFCDRCLIEIHSCNIAPQFSHALAQSTGCQVVAGTGRVAPRYADDNTGRTDHMWSSTSEDSGSDCKTVAGEACGADFFRYTPEKGTDGQVANILEERLGRYYTAQ